MSFSKEDIHQIIEKSTKNRGINIEQFPNEAINAGVANIANGITNTANQIDKGTQGRNNGRI